jgi:hypothetical protein
VLLARLDTDNGPIVVIGFDREEIDQMFGGSPARPIQLEELGIMAPIRVMIAVADTTEEMKADLVATAREHGVDVLDVNEGFGGNGGGP